MFKSVLTPALVGLVLISLTAGVLSVLVEAQVQERPPQPRDYFWSEIASGTLGGLAGGFITMAAALYVIGRCYDFSSCIGQGAFVEMIFLVGNLVGATYSVIKAGSSKHVQGNIPLAVAGAVMGEATGLFILGLTGVFSVAVSRGDPLTFYVSSHGDPMLIFSFLAISTALGATLGFNLGATMEVKMLNVNQDRLELVSTRVRW